MRIAFTTTFDAQDVHNWSGTPFYMVNALSQAGMMIEHIGPLTRKLPPFFKAKQIITKYLAQQRLSPRFNTFVAQHYSQQVATQLNNKTVDVVISPLINPIAYLEWNKPIVLWTDAVYAGLVGFYPPFAFHSARTIQDGNAMTADCLSRCRYAVFSSDWAAQHAIHFYGVSKDKVKVIPFGANIEQYPTLEQIRTIIAQRPTNKLRLLFLAKSWERKGGDIVLAVTEQLHRDGVPVELTIVGIKPPIKNMPDYVRCLGFISKHTDEGKTTLQRLLAESHFLFVPSRAEAYGIVFCEANAYGVPCLTTYVGGIGTIVKDHINGMTFALDAPLEQYCDYLQQAFADNDRYKNLALSSYNEFTSRLNWQAAAREMQRLLQTL